ncbi:MAG: hypothetical protein K2X57_14910, partial [Xanthobacteraceae bacterium]|nr:hypothetical protein [Xanthobacteraceae bacterium]
GNWQPCFLESSWRLLPGPDAPSFDQLPHHGGADDAVPPSTKYNHHQPSLWKPAHTRPRHTFALHDIALHARRRKNVSNETIAKKTSLNSFWFGAIAHRTLLTRTGCATILSSVPSHQTKFVFWAFKK